MQFWFIVSILIGIVKSLDGYLKELSWIVGTLRILINLYGSISFDIPTGSGLTQGLLVLNIFKQLLRCNKVPAMTLYKLSYLTRCQVASWSRDHLSWFVHSLIEIPKLINFLQVGSVKFPFSNFNDIFSQIWNIKF